MSILRTLSFVALCGTALTATAADPYPTKPMELVVAYQPGGGSDNTARAIADKAKAHLPQSVVVINKPGASGSIGWTYVVSGTTSISGFISDSL